MGGLIDEHGYDVKSLPTGCLSYEGHGLRHTHAAQLRVEGVDIGIISRQLGHVSITTTVRYLDHIAPRAVIEAMRRRRWTSV